MQNITKEEEHIRQLLKRVHNAHALGQFKKRDYWVRTYLDSYDAKLLAIRRANKKFKLNRRFDDKELQAMASGMDAWKGTTEEVLVHLKRKPSNPCDFRIYMAFGIQNRGLQYLIFELLKELAEIEPYQYTARGGVKAAIMHAVNAMSAGPVWAIELDVTDCYPSFDGKKLPGLLPLPEEVSTNVLISEYLNMKGGNITYHFGPTGIDDPGAPFMLEETLVEARRGIPQGSATSSLIAEMVLAMALKQVPILGHKIAYGDNSLLLAKSEGDLVAMTQALESALKAHPVGLFWPKAKKFLPGQPIKFLGHLLTPKHGGHVHIAPSPENRAKFEAEMASKLKRLKTKMMPDVMARERQQARHYVRSWTAAFSLSEGIEDERNYWMQWIKATTPLSA
jgi:hypothetical protein